MMRFPARLETPRLYLRPFAPDDLASIHQILDVDLAEADFGSAGALTLDDRRQWLEWTIRNYEQLAQLYQPPYGDRAVTLKDSGELIGAAGFVPSFAPFEQLGLGPSGEAGRPALFTPEFGLYYAIAPRRQRQGFALEAAGALVRYAFSELRVKRLVATTKSDNAGSIGVMRRLGMRLARNPLPDPPWLQVVGVLENNLTGQ